MSYRDQVIFYPIPANQGHRCISLKCEYDVLFLVGEGLPQIGCCACLECMEYAAQVAVGVFLSPDEEKPSY